MSWFSSLFSDGRTISVDQVVYNLAGPENKRPNFLTTTTLGAVMSTSGMSVSEQLNNAYLTGPGIKIRQFASWARTPGGYDSLVGFNATPVTLTSAINQSVLEPLLPTMSGASIIIQSSAIGPADYTFWVGQYMVSNYPSLLTTAYTCSFDATTNTATINLVSGLVVTFVIPGFDTNAFYLYVTYNFDVAAIPAIPYSAGPPVVMAVAAVTESWTPMTFFAYKQGSGNSALDALFATTSDAGYFMPYIPVVIDKKFVSNTYLPDVYAKSVVAARKALMGSSYDKISAQIAANPSVASIDYAYIVFAVSLNVLENDCRNYIYEFFLQIMTGLDLSSTDYAAWQAAWNTAAASMATWATWQAAQSDPTNPLYGTTQPTVIAYPQSPGYSVRVASDGDAVMNYDITIAWDGLTENHGTGQLTNDLGALAQANTFWFTTVSNTVVNGSVWVNSVVGSLPITQTQSHVRLNWQVTTNTWRCLDIYNLTHTNKIYQGNSVVIHAADALASTTESAFLIPLNESIYKHMPLSRSTQMATACCFIVFTAYTITKTPWWAQSVWQYIFIVAGIALAVFTAGASTIGLLGTDLAVGTALGLTGTAAILTGALVNAVAAIVLVQIVQMGATQLLGPQIGAIVGAIIGVLALEVGTSMMNGGLSTLLNTVLQPANLLKLTESAGNGVAQFMQIGAQNIEKSTQTMLQQYNAASVTLEAQYQQMFGNSGGAANVAVNPLNLVDTSVPNTSPFKVYAEAPSDFMSRTLLTGSDVSNLSMSYVNNFCDVTLTQQLPAQT